MGNRGKDLPSGTDTVDVEADTSSSLADHGAVLEGIVDAVDRVILHADEEARRELRVRGTGVEEGRGRVGEVSLGHEVVGLEDTVEVAAVDTNGDTHDHVLGTLGGAAIDTEKVGTLEGLEAKVVVVEVAVVDDGGVKDLGVVLDDLVGLV